MLGALPFNLKHLHGEIWKTQETTNSMHHNTAHHRDIRLITVDDERATPLVGDDDIISGSAVMTDSRCRIDDTSDRL